MARPTVALVMIARDESAHLERCLRSVEGLVDEVVIVDTGSRDSTVAIAGSLGAQVCSEPWNDSFSDARNASLARARADWAFWLDADEWLDTEGRTHFAAVRDTLDDRKRLYLMTQTSPLGLTGGELRIAQPRLFRRVPGLAWRYRVHEQVLDPCLELGFEVVSTDVIIRHSGYESAEAAARKRKRNLRLLELDLRDFPDDPWIHFQLGRDLLEDRFAEAERHLLGALERLEPASSIARRARGTLTVGYRKHGRLAEARASALVGLSRFPNDTTLLFEAGNLALSAEDFSEAEACFRRLISEPPDADEAFVGIDPTTRRWRSRHNLALVLLRTDRLGEAERHWREALAEQPSEAPLWAGLAASCQAQGKGREFREAVAGLRGVDPGAAKPFGTAVKRASIGSSGAGRVPISYRRRRRSRTWKVD
jgi:tetratricopeptide (TPR) repeat protein